MLRWIKAFIILITLIIIIIRQNYRKRERQRDRKARIKTVIKTDKTNVHVNVYFIKITWETVEPQVVTLQNKNNGNFTTKKTGQH